MSKAQARQLERIRVSVVCRNVMLSGWGYDYMLASYPGLPSQLFSQPSRAFFMAAKKAARVFPRLRGEAWDMHGCSYHNHLLISQKDEKIEAQEQLVKK